MKYALITIGALVLAALLSFYIVLLINKRFRLRLYARIIIGLFGVAAFSVLFALAFFAFNYRATDVARDYLKNDEIVQTCLKLRFLPSVLHMHMTVLNGDLTPK